MQYFLLSKDLWMPQASFSLGYKLIVSRQQELSVSGCMDMRLSLKFNRQIEILGKHGQ